MKAAMSVRRVTRGVMPANMPLMPVLWQMERTVSSSRMSCVARSCTLVFTTSAGWVMMEAIRPAATPHEKRSGGASVSEWVAVCVGGGGDDVLHNTRSMHYCTTTGKLQFSVENVIIMQFTPNTQFTVE